MEEKKSFIPCRLKNAAVGGHVAGTEDIYDDVIGKDQQEINAQHEAALNAPSTGVIARLETLEGEVSFSGDFEAENNPSGIVSGGEKITTTNAVNGALDYAGYFECSSNADAVTKAVLNTGYALRNGGCIKIKMTNANTADNVKLQLGNAEAKDLYYDGSRVGSGNSWEAGEVIEVYYDGTAFYANNISGGGKFATGEKVKEISIEEEPTEDSNNLVTSGGVYNATNIAHDVDFADAMKYYVSSNDDSIVSNVNHLSVEVENKNYSSVVLTAGFNDTVPYAISFFSGTPSADTFISGVQSQGNTLYEYKADVPIGCKYIVVSCRTSYTPSATCFKNIQGLERDIENKSVKIQMTSFDKLELVNMSSSTSSSEKQQGGVICINSIANGGRSGFKFGNILTTGKEYAVEFDIESDSTANGFTCNFADGTSNALFTKNVANNAHTQIIFTSVDNLNAIYLSTSQIGAGKTLYLKNIMLYESIPLDAFCNNVQEEVKGTNVRVDALGDKITQVVCDEETYTGEIIKGFVASGSKEITNQNSFATHVISNDNYVKVFASCGNKDTGAYAVAFYSTNEIVGEGFISGALFVVGQHDYALPVPNNCKIIVISSRIYDGNYDYTLDYEVTGYYNRAKIDINNLNARLTDVENTIEGGDTAGGEIVHYSGNELSLSRHSFSFKQLTTQGLSIYAQGFTYANGYAFSAANGGTLRVIKFNDFTPNMVFVRQYNLQSYSTQNHANSLNFGKYYAEDDQFPALYISECYGGQRCFVERIGLSSSTLIQTITLSTVSEHFGIYLNWVPDLNRNRLLAVGVVPNSQTRFNVIEFTLPDFTESSITLTDSDILKEYEIANNYLLQGCCICGDMLLLPVGQAAGSQNIIFYDLLTNEIINTLRISDEVGEPEDCALKDDSLILSAANGYYLIKFV